MNKILSLIAGAGVALSLVACMDSHDEPNLSHVGITADSIAAPNTNILALKRRFQTSITGRNTFEKVTEDVIFEGVVVANDVSGNLYQTIVLRSIGSTAGATDDQCIQLGIKQSTLYPYFELGQRVRVNLRDLYIGNYSNTPKIGQPYYTSAGNLRLGPMLVEMVSKRIQLVGKPNPQAPELTPIDLTTSAGKTWLSTRSNQNYLNAPLLGTVEGVIVEMQGAAANVAERGALSADYEPLPKIFAPEALYDAGYAVNRNIRVSGSSETVLLRTSTQNNLSFLRLPADTRRYTGVLSFYSGWQLQLRSADDIVPAI